MNYEVEGKNKAFTKTLRNRLDADQQADMNQAIIRAKAIYDEHHTLPFREQPSITPVYQLIHNLTTPKYAEQY